jgi:hypothetical protein
MPPPSRGTASVPRASSRRRPGPSRSRVRSPPAGTPTAVPHASGSIANEGGSMAVTTSRDFGLMPGALTLARLTAVYDVPWRRR